MIETGWLSVLPPIIAIMLAMLTKEVYSSLFIGLFSGMLIQLRRRRNDRFSSNNIRYDVFKK